jgi:hypothetical protein
VGPVQRFSESRGNGVLDGRVGGHVVGGVGILYD